MPSTATERTKRDDTATDEQEATSEELTTEIQILGPPPNVDGERPFESPKETPQEGELKGANENSLAFRAQ